MFALIKRKPIEIPHVMKFHQTVIEIVKIIVYYVFQRTQNK